MAIATQQTELYVYDTTDAGVVTKIGCPTSISGAGSTTEQVETTCLEATSRSYIPGLATPGEVSFDVFFDTSDTSHMLLETLRKNRTTTEWAIGFSDGSSAPTGGGGSPLTFTGRSSIAFTGFVTSVQFSFEGNSAVSASIGIQVSGDVSVSAAA